MMSQYEILRMASIGICARMDREKQINELTKEEHGRENGISVHKLEKLTEQFAEVQQMMGDLERAPAQSN